MSTYSIHRMRPTRVFAAGLAVVFLIILVLASLMSRWAELAGAAAVGGAGAVPGRHQPNRHQPNRHHFPAAVTKFARMTPEAIDYSALEISPGKVSLYSSLLPWHAPDVNAALRAEFPTPPAEILDATAHIGADSANFLSVFPGASLTAIEISPQVAAILRRNAAKTTRALGLPSGRFRVINADANIALGLLGAEPFPDLRRRYDLVFFDPPWGGSLGDAAVPAATLCLGPLPLTSVVAGMLRQETVSPDGIERPSARVVLAKVPKRTDLDEFDEKVGQPATRYPIRDIRHANGKDADALLPSYWILAYRTRDPAG
jgi:hypothetical protein